MPLKVRIKIHNGKLSWFLSGNDGNHGGRRLIINCDDYNLVLVHTLLQNREMGSWIAWSIEYSEKEKKNYIFYNVVLEAVVVILLFCEREKDMIMTDGSACCRLCRQSILCVWNLWIKKYMFYSLCFFGSQHFLKVYVEFYVMLNEWKIKYPLFKWNERFIVDLWKLSHT